MVIHVAYSCDENYLQHFCVSLHSLIDAEDLEVKCHLFYSGSPDSVLLREVVANFGDIVSVYHPDHSDFSSAKIDSNIPIAAYFRLLLTDYLQEIDRVLYLDCDTVVTSSIRPLYEIDLEGNAIGAVVDAGVSHSIKEKLGVDSYFNSGVLIIDLEKFAKKRMSMFGFMKEHDRITFHDQCVLNYIFNNNWLELNPKWNYMSNNFLLDNQGLFSFSILHFNSIFGKPWERNCKHPLKCLYLHVKSKTLFKDTPLERGRIVVTLRNRFSLIDRLLKVLRGY